MPNTGYPTLLPGESKVINFIPAGIQPYNPSYDIVWSFEYNLCGSNSLAEGGFTTFLMEVLSGKALPQVKELTYLTGGNFGIDLGYSGLSANNFAIGKTSTNLLSTTNITGVLSAVLGIGFDSTGLFALSASYINGSLSYNRDGVALNNIKKNSLIVRKGYPTYSLAYSQELSNLPGNITLLDNTGENFNRLRFRLGNVGRTLYVDCKQPTAISYTNILTLPVNLAISDSTAYAIGISFASPISSISSSNISTLRIKNFHIEGRTDIIALAYDVTTGVSDTFTRNLITETYTTLSGSLTLSSSTTLSALSGELDIIAQGSPYDATTQFTSLSFISAGTVFYA